MVNDQIDSRLLGADLEKREFSDHFEWGARTFMNDALFSGAGSQSPNCIGVVSI